MSRLEVLENKTYLTEMNSIPMKFTVEVLWKGRTFKHIFRAIHLQDLSEQIEDYFPGAKIVSAIGG